MRDSIETYFIKMAELVAERATCPRRQVGCVIVDEHNHVMATGYNGVPRNFPHCIDTPCGGQNNKAGQKLESCMATHAEQNALLQCGDVMKIDTIYLTVLPCITCAKLIANTGCKRVVYRDDYPNHAGIFLLEKLNIKVDRREINAIN